MSIVELIYEILKPLGYETTYIVRGGVPSISFHFFNEIGDLFGDGSENSISGMLQVDFFTKEPASVRFVRKEIIDAIEPSNSIIFTKTTPDECTYDDSVQIYHQVIVFEFLYLKESEVL